MANKKIRVHNKGNREYTIPGEKKGENKFGKPRMLQPGRAIELDEKTAKKYIEAYPNDLIEFDSLVSGEKKNISKENDRLESENASHLEKIGKIEPELKTLKEKVKLLEANADPDVNAMAAETETLKGEKLSLEEKVLELQIFIEDSGLEVPVEATEQSTTADGANDTKEATAPKQGGTDTKNKA